MEKINDGGPAFHSTTVYENWTDYQQGMTLRDYFAAKVMNGFAADPTTPGEPDLVAITAYEWADAMLEARKK